MKHLLSATLLLILLFASCKKEGSLPTVSLPEGRGIEKAEEFGFHLSMQSATFADTTLVVAFERTAELEIGYIEIDWGHTIGGEWGDKPFNFDLNPKEQQDLKTLASKHQLKIVSTGVVILDNANEWEKLFVFAQNMGLEYIVCEPAYEHLYLIGKLADKTGIKVGLHNYFEPSNYWNPSVLLNKIENYTPNIGACADVGNWAMEGLDQIECLEYLRGNIQSLHFKDIGFKRRHHAGDPLKNATPWGIGVLDVDAMLIELKQQNFSGYLTIEHKSESKNLMTDLKDCLFYYDVVCLELFKEGKPTL